MNGVAKVFRPGISPFCVCAHTEAMHVVGRDLNEHGEMCAGCSACAPPWQRRLPEHPYEQCGCHHYESRTRDL